VDSSQCSTAENIPNSDDGCIWVKALEEGHECVKNDIEVNCVLYFRYEDCGMEKNNDRCVWIKDGDAGVEECIIVNSAASCNHYQSEIDCTHTNDDKNCDWIGLSNEYCEARSNLTSCSILSDTQCKMVNKQFLEKEEEYEKMDEPCEWATSSASLNVPSCVSASEIIDCQQFKDQEWCDGGHDVSGTQCHFDNVCKSYNCFDYKKEENCADNDNIWKVNPGCVWTGIQCSSEAEVGCDFTKKELCVLKTGCFWNGDDDGCTQKASISSCEELKEKDSCQDESNFQYLQCMWVLSNDLEVCTDSNKVERCYQIFADTKDNENNCNKLIDEITEAYCTWTSTGCVESTCVMYNTEKACEDDIKGIAHCSYSYTKPGCINSQDIVCGDFDGGHCGSSSDCFLDGNACKNRSGITECSNLGSSKDLCSTGTKSNYPNLSLDGTKCVWTNEGGCVDINSIEDCTIFGSAETCENSVAGIYTCHWSSSSCVEYTCEDYTGSSPCNSNLRNIYEGCVWSSASPASPAPYCKSLEEAICGDFVRSDCGVDYYSGKKGLRDCFWNGLVDGSCVSEDMIDECVDLFDKENCENGNFDKKEEECIWKSNNKCEAMKCVDVVSGCGTTTTTVNGDVCFSNGNSCSAKEEITNCNELNTLTVCMLTDFPKLGDVCVWAKTLSGSPALGCMGVPEVVSCDQHVISSYCQNAKPNNESCEWIMESSTCVAVQKSEKEDENKAQTIKDWWWLFVVIGVIVILAVILLVIIVVVMRRRKKNKKKGEGDNIAVQSEQTTTSSGGARPEETKAEEQVEAEGESEEDESPPDEDESEVAEHAQEKGVEEYMDSLILENDV
jgi:hypothetical protein